MRTVSLQRGFWFASARHLGMLPVQDLNLDSWTQIQGHMFIGGSIFFQFIFTLRVKFCRTPTLKKGESTDSGFPPWRGEGILKNPQLIFVTVTSGLIYFSRQAWHQVLGSPLCVLTSLELMAQCFLIDDLRCLLYFIQLFYLSSAERFIQIVSFPFLEAHVPSLIFPFGDRVRRADRNIPILLIRK